MADWQGAFAGHLEPGKSPALLLVDPVAAYVEPESPLFLESGSAALHRMAELIDLFRAHALPIVWTGVRYRPGGIDGGHFFRKVPALEVFVGDSALGAFPDKVRPNAQDPVFIKQFPSAFFETGLTHWLEQHGIDTVYIGGFSTSGCVRASALDALQNGFIPITVADACADRNSDIHTQNLRDLGAKYSEIIASTDVPGLLSRLDPDPR